MAQALILQAIREREPLGQARAGCGNGKGRRAENVLWQPYPLPVEVRTPRQAKEGPCRRLAVVCLRSSGVRHLIYQGKVRGPLLVGAAPAR